MIGGRGGEIEAHASAINRAATPRAMPKQQGDAANLLRPKAKLSPSSASSSFCSRSPSYILRKLFAIACELSNDFLPLATIHYKNYSPLTKYFSKRNTIYFYIRSFFCTYKIVRFTII